MSCSVSRMSLRRWAGVWLLLQALVLGAQATFAQTSQNEGSPSLRERIKEKLAQRSASAIPKTDSPSTQPITAPGTYRFTLQHGGLNRAYLVHVPRGYVPTKPTPVVFAFHGGGGNMNMQADTNYNIVGKSDSAGYIAVFPNGYSRLPSGYLATWNAGNCCAGARDRNVDDVGFVRAIVKQLLTLVNVDSARIFATGMSNGGMLSHRLACEMADTFRAIASVAGTDGTLSCTPARPVSVLHIHAQNDTHVLFNGGAGKDAFGDTSKVADFVSVPETMARWRQRNRCSAPPKRVLEVPGAYCEASTQCAEGVQVQLCVTETGGHSWPGADKVRSGKEPASKALSANDVMWDFFQQVSGR